MTPGQMEMEGTYFQVSQTSGKMAECHMNFFGKNLMNGLK